MSVINWRLFVALILMSVAFILLSHTLSTQPVTTYVSGNEDEATSTDIAHDDPANDPEGNPAVCTTSTRASLALDLCRRRGYDKEAISWARCEQNLIVDDRHRLLFCSIPKCGSKSFKHFLGELSTPDFFVGWSVNMKKYYNVTSLRPFGNLTETEKETVLRDYLKFVVVRHPFDRLRSAWLHKMSEPAKSHILHGMEGLVDEFLRKFDPSRDKAFNYRDEYLEFESFLGLVHEKWDSGFRNAHWASYYEHCQPCHIRYDHVLRLETLSDDVEVIYRHLSRLNVSDTAHRLNHDNKVQAAEGIHRMKNIDLVYDGIDNKTMRGLMALYERDFLLFGYKWDREDGATCSYDDLDCC